MASAGSQRSLAVGRLVVLLEGGQACPVSRQLAWRGLQGLHRAGFGRAAAGIANLLVRDRHFAIDDQGHWENRQREATIVSPDFNIKRYAFLADQVADEWFWDGAPEGIVFDIGAGTGEDSVVMAPLAQRLYAIEAHPGVFACLARTIALSKLANVTPVHCALSDRDGQTRISDETDHIANRIGGSAGAIVPMRSLRSLCDDLGVERIDFLKMNIEGAERLAVHGFGDVDIRRMVISCHDFIPGEFTQTREYVRQWLHEHGYQVRQRSDHPRPWTRNYLYARRDSVRAQKGPG